MPIPDSKIVAKQAIIAKQAYRSHKKASKLKADLKYFNLIIGLKSKFGTQSTIFP